MSSLTNTNALIDTNASFNKESPQSNYSSNSSNTSQSSSSNDIFISKLIYSISQVLHNIITQNKTNNNNNIQRHNNSFYSTKVPQISIYDYLLRIKTYSQLEDTTLIISLILIDRFVQQSNIQLSYNNIHRILFTAVLISIKYNEDNIFTNNYYAEIAGVSVKELFTLENDFLSLVNFNLYIEPILFAQYNLYLNNIITKY